MPIPLALALLAQAQPYPQPQLEAGRELLALRAADLDADGRPDLVCVDAASSELVAARGLGGAEVALPLRRGTGARPIALRLADVTGDGRVDALVAWRGPAESATATGGISVHPGGGHGGFEPPLERRLSFVPAVLELEDVNGDGLLDVLLVGEAPKGDVVTVLPGRGGGVFGPETQTLLGAPVTSLACGHLDEDGLLDLFACASEPGVEAVLLFAGRAGGTWAPAGRLPLQALQDIAVADLDGDGRDDVVAAAGLPFDFGLIATFLATGPGRYGAPLLAQGGLGIPEIQLRDLDGDGRLDLLASAVTDPAATPPYGGIYVHWAAGDGSFSSFDELRSSGQAPLSVVAGDFDDRAGLDVAFARGALDLPWFPGPKGYLGVVRQLGSRTFEGPRFVQPGNVVGTAVRCADFDLDGIDDVAAVGHHFVDARTFLVLRRGLPGGGLGPPRSVPLSRPGCAVSAARQLGVGDFDGDRFPDVLALGSAGAVVLRGGAPDLVGVPLPAGVLDVLPRCVDDWDGDGAQEFAERRFVGGSGFGLAFHGVRGDAVVERAFLPGLDALAPRGGDVDGDGLADLVYFAPGVDAIAVRRGNGDFSFGPPTLLPFPQSPAASLETADLDGDGRVEILALAGGAGELSLFRSNGGGFDPPHRLPLGISPRGPVAADLDGDGLLEVLVPNRLGANVTVLPGRADGTLGSPRTIGATFQIQDLALRRTGDGGPPEILFTDGAFHLFGVLEGASGR